MSLNCTDIQKQMNALKDLKAQFDIAYRDAQIFKNTKDTIRAQSLKKQLQESLEAIKQPLFLHVIEQRKLLDYPLFSDLIARNKEEIDERTKVYISPLKPDLFKHLPPSIEYIYLNYPKVRIYREALEAGGHSVKEIKQIVGKKNKTRRWLDELLKTSTFERSLYTDTTRKTLKPTEILNLIYITVEQLGFTGRPTTQEIYDRAQELGLSICSSSVEFYYRLKYNSQIEYGEQAPHEWPIIDMALGEFAGTLHLSDNCFDEDRSVAHCLIMYDGRLHERWDPDDFCVFIAPSSLAGPAERDESS